MKKQKGQSLFEIVLALGVILLLIGGLVVAATTSIRNTTVSTSQAEATRFAQEVMEWLREEKGKDWGTFFGRASSSGTIYCLNSLSWPSSSGSCGSSSFIVNTQYQRKATLTTDGLDKVRVTVTVSWQEGGRSHTTDVSSVFTNWK